MYIQTIHTEKATEYYQLLERGITEHADFFRIAPQDLRHEPFPTQNTADSFTLIAYSDKGEMLGTVGFQREQNRLKLRHKGLLFRMYVVPESAGQGIGRKLIQEVIKRVKALGDCRQIVLTVAAKNHIAKKLYHSEGFELFSFEKDAIQLGGNRFADEESMILFLTP